MNTVEIDFWLDHIGCNPIGVRPDKKPKIEWSEFQDKAMSKDEFKLRKERGEYVDGCAVITGKLWRGPHKDKYLGCLDFDNSAAIDIFLKQTYALFGCRSLEEFSQKTIVEEHEDAKGERAHVYFVTSSPITKRNRLFRNKSIEGQVIPEIEVKSDSSTYVVCSPTIHKNGYPYQILGIREPLVLDDDQSKILDDHISDIYASFGLHSKDSISNLLPELRLIAKTGRIGLNPPKIFEGSRSNTLIAFGSLLLHQNYQRKDIDLKALFAEVNQKLCVPPLPEDELKSIWNQDVKYLLKDLESGKMSLKKDDDKKDIENSSKAKSKTEFLTYKYTFKEQIYEAVIVDDKPFFLTVKEGQILLESFLEEETRILRPPALEEYPSYGPYSFENIAEVSKYVNLVNSKNISLDRIVSKIREQISLYVVHHDYILDYIATLVLFSYFQDKFPTVLYTMFVSDNGSGKSTIGNVFECFAYRGMNMTDPTTANIFRIFGMIEAGQCSLILDEAEKIDQDKDMMSILKTGYERNKKVQRINPFGKQEHFHTFGLKVMLAERSPNPFYAKGVLDRTFIISNFKGRPQLDIKETKISEKGKTEFSFYKNLLLVYRLLHFGREIQDIDTGLEGRDKELCKPPLQLFFNTNFQPKLEKALEILLNEKYTRKANSLEREILEVIIDLIRMEHTDGIIPIPKLWEEVINKTSSTRNQFDELNVISESHGSISKNTILKMVRDRFGAKEKRNTKARCLCFDLNNILKNYEDYIKEQTPTKIVCKPVPNNDANDANDANIESLFQSFMQSEGGPLSNLTITKWTKLQNSLNQTSIETTGIKTEQALSTNFSKGFGNSVIPVIPVIETQMINPKENDNLEKEQINHTNNIRHKWQGGDIWICENCNDSGDKWHMLKHPCKNNKK